MHQVSPSHIHHGGKPATNLPHDSSPNRHAFRYLGRTWTLTKRTNSPDAYWHLAAAVKGQRIRETLATSSIKHAEALAKALIDELFAGLRKPKVPQCATLAEIQSALPRLTIKAKTKTRDEYFANLERCLVHALDMPREKLLSVRLDALTDEAGAKLFAWVEEEAVKLPSQADQRRFRASWVSMFEQSLALFAPRAEYQLRKTLGLTIPDMRDWRTAGKKHGPRLMLGSGAAVPDDGIIRRTLIEWVKMGRTPGYVCRNRDYRVREAGRTRFEAGPLSELARRNMFLAIGLELSCGLRKSEIPRARWSWRKVFSGIPHLSELDTEVKNATGEVQIVPLDPFWNFMLGTAARNGWIGKPDEPWLIWPAKVAKGYYGLRFADGGETHATYYPFESIGWWLRDLGWATQKTNHALRDYVASMITMRYSLAHASAWCRHTDLATTHRSYNRFVTLAGKVNPKRLAWLRWAK